MAFLLPQNTVYRPAFYPIFQTVTFNNRGCNHHGLMGEQMPSVNVPR